MSKLDTNELRQNVDTKLNDYLNNFYENVPYAKYLKDSETIDKDYFLRHSIEIVLRIRHKRMIDALVIHYFTKNDLRQAKAWANYAEDEMLHGNMFAMDLKRLYDISLEEIYKVEPTFATQLLNGYFYYTLEHEGPLASLISAYFLEYTTRMTQPEWLDNLESIFGKENLRGARGHVDHDIADDHNDFVWRVIAKELKSENDIKRLFTHLERIGALFSAYFVELYQETINKSSRDNILNVTRAAVSAAKQ